jgi:class 3 adenylate cyclase/tetratricopeptide (TPR) repeat protein
MSTPPTAQPGGRPSSRGAARPDDGSPGAALAPYVPRILDDWLRYTPDLRYRRIPGTAVFADISGFTDLTERLSARGKIGAEEMGETLNAIFDAVLSPAYDFGAGLLKWGGDAVLLLFEDELHASRACRAAVEMQAAIRRSGRITSSVGPVRLQMSIGVHTGAFDFLLVGAEHGELVVTGPGATTVTAMEKAADANEIMGSAATVEALTDVGKGSLYVAKGPGFLLSSAPAAPTLPSRTQRPVSGVPYHAVLPPPVCDHLLAAVSEPEHRHVAVGFVEFSGVDRLVAEGRTEELTEAVAAVVDKAQVAAADHEVTFLATDVNGDGGKVILVAGVPRTAGDDEGRLLAAVRRVVGSCGPLPLRGGVHCGRVFAGDFGPSYRRTYSVVGDCVNLAARLMAKAQPGQVLATGTVLERSRTTFHTVAVPPFRVKGKRAEIHAFDVGDPSGAAPDVRPQIASGGHRDLLPFVGREDELEVLVAATAGLGDGAGAVVDLVGPAGIGKSRLLTELVDRTGIRTLWTDGDVGGTATPYLPFARLFRMSLGFEPSADSDAERGALRARLEDLVEHLAPALRPWLPLIGMVAGVELPWTAEIEATHPDQRKVKLEEVTSQALAAVLTEPTVLVFNDLHFMDEASVSLLRRLAGDASGRPWLLVTTRRPHQHSVVLEAPAAIVLELHPLDDAAAERLLVAAADDAPLAPHRMAAMAERAAGNPLFLRELAAGAKDLGDSDAIPESIEGIIAARIDRLHPMQRRLLRSASVLGMTVDTDVLAELIGDEARPAVHSAREWDQLAEFVRQVDDGRVQFVHHLVREVAYEGLPFRRRATLHGRAAELLQRSAHDLETVADPLSMHCLAAGYFEGAWSYGRLAGERARARFANVDAATCYGRALVAAPHLRLARGELAEIHETLGDIHFDLGEFERAEASFRRARGQRSLGPVWTARLALKVATSRDSAGRFVGALRWLTQAENSLVGLEDADARAMAGRIAARRARVRYLQGRYREAVRWAQHAIAEAGPAGDERTQAQALELIAVSAVALGQADELSKAYEALEIYERLEDLSGQARAHSCIGVGCHFVGRWDEALEHYTSAEEAYERAGLRWGAVTALANRGEVFIDQGRIEEATYVLEAAMTVWQGVRAEPEIAFGNSLLGRIAALSGRFDEAFERLESARRHCAEQGEGMELLIVDSLTAEALLLAGRADEAADLARATIAQSVKAGATSTTLPMLHRVLGLALERLGRHGDAVAALRTSLDIARRRDARHEIAFTLGALLGVDRSAGEVEAAQWRREQEELSASLGILGAGAGTIR